MPVTDTIDIPGAPDNPYVARTDLRFDYAADKSKCPACSGLGFPWSGWFSCEDCGAIAVIADGRVFVPTDENRK